MAKKTADTDQPKHKKPTSQKTTTAKQKKQQVDDDDDDFDDPVWIDPNEQAKAALSSEKQKEPQEHNVTQDEKEFNVEVTKAKITNDIFLSASWKVISKVDRGSYDKNGENPIHDDLKKSFENLNKHLADMSQQYNADGKLDSGRIVCRGFSIGSNGEGVTLHGTRHLSNGKAFNFNSPFYKWDNEPGEQLFEEEAESLKTAINKCRSEIIQYLFKHKYQAEVVNE